MKPARLKSLRTIFDYYALGCKEEKRNVKAEDIEKRRFKSKNDKMTARNLDSHAKRSLMEAAANNEVGDIHEITPIDLVEMRVTKTYILELEDMSMAGHLEPRRKIMKEKKKITLVHS